ncbi:MAG: FemAB family XrtA/PEP-CTERM system-associated protein [Cellvibrionaceae bacterium]
MSLVIRRLDTASRERWDYFVDNCPEATFFHKSGWKRVIEEAFGHPTYFFYAQQNGRVVGVLPLVHVRSMLFGNSLVSTPFCVYGGIVAENDTASDMLRQHACELAKELDVDSLELRHQQYCDSDWLRKELYVTFKKSIPQDPEQVLLSIPNKQRAVVRKGIKSGLSYSEGWHGGRMHKVYSESVRNLGTPVFSRHYFDILRDEFGEDCRSLMIQHDGVDVAGVLSFYFKDEVLPYYAGSTSASKGLHAHGYMYWALMKSAAQQGVGSFDFGRSKIDTGSYSFKKNWGFKPTPLSYEYHLVNSDTIPNVNPTNPKYGLLIKAWRNLPLPIANTVGPWLAKSLG